MGTSFYIIGLIIVFAIVLIAFNNRSLENSILRGFWCADASFCQKAELEMFVLYLGDNISYAGNSRNGYLLAANKNGIILNNPIEMNFKGYVNVLPHMPDEINYDVVIDWKDNPPTDEQAFPTYCKASYYPKYGKLVFYHDNQVIASLWKDNQMSSLTSNTSLNPDDVKYENDSEIKNNVEYSDIEDDAPLVDLPTEQSASSTNN